jgi:hypothetical protein
MVMIVILGAGEFPMSAGLRFALFALALLAGFWTLPLTSEDPPKEKTKAEKDAEKAAKEKDRVEKNIAKMEADRTKKLNEATVEFHKSVENAKKTLLTDYDRALQATKTAPGLTAAARKDKMDDVKKAKKLFEDATKFPADDEFAELELKYHLLVNKAYTPIAKIIDQTIELGNQADFAKFAVEGQALKISIEKQLLGENKFTANTRWHGTLKKGGGTIPYHLNLGKMSESGTFRGHVEDNVGVQGNWSYDVEGQCVGKAVEFAMTKSTRGNFKAVRVVGVVSGDRLIAEISQTTGGKPGKGILVLNRR